MRSGVLGAIIGFLHRWAWWALVAWVAVATAGNLAFPQMEHEAHVHAQQFLPSGSSTARSLARMQPVFPSGGSNNVTYLVVEADHRLGGDDHAYYDALLDHVRADRRHVRFVMDLWSQPMAQSVAESADHRAAYVMVWLAGQIGDSESRDSIRALSAIVGSVSAPAGLHVYLTGPGMTNFDNGEALDKQILLITAATVVLIAALLFVVYRSALAVSITLTGIGLGLAVARAVVSALAERGLIEVSSYSTSFMAAIVLGAGVDYAIFLIGRYHEQRRQGQAPAIALTQAYLGVAPIIVASAATVATALFCLGFAKIAVLRSAGAPSAIGVLGALAAALTVIPAMLALAVRRGWLEPRSATTTRLWRRIGVVVVRWPVPVLSTALAALVVMALPLFGVRLSYSEPKSLPDAAASNRGYQAMDRHFRPNELFPALVVVQSDHELRNPAGLIGVERLSRAVLAVPGVRTVQSASRPSGAALTESSFPYQAGQIGQNLQGGLQSFQSRLESVKNARAILAQALVSVRQLEQSLKGSVNGLGQVGSGADTAGAGVRELQKNAQTASEYLDPLRDFVSNNANCERDFLCSLARKVIDPVDGLLGGVGLLSDGVAELSGGSARTTSALAGAGSAVAGLGDSLARLRGLVDTLASAADTFLAQFQPMTEYLQSLSEAFQGSGEGGFYLPRRAFGDPRFQALERVLFSSDGHATALLAYQEGQAWGVEGAQNLGKIAAALREAMKEGTLKDASAQVSGVGAIAGDIQAGSDHDLVLAAVVTLALVFCIVLAMLRSPVAGVVVVATVVLSFLSAMGVSVLIWQYLLGEEPHWVVPELALIVLMAVGVDYNLLLVVRMKEEASSGRKTGILRAFGGTGGMVTTAGLVFGCTMFALLASDVKSIAETGSTIGIGLCIDTLVVRTFVVPAIAAWWGRWFFWPDRQVR